MMLYLALALAFASGAVVGAFSHRWLALPGHLAAMEARIVSQIKAAGKKSK